MDDGRGFDPDDREPGCSQCQDSGLIGESADWYCRCERGQRLRDIDADHGVALVMDAAWNMRPRSAA